jgi:hypothetical protein
MAEPIDHLAGKTGYTHELIAALTDVELDDQLAYFRAGAQAHLNQPDPEGATMYQSHAYAAFRYGNWVGMVLTERRSRGLSDGWSDQFTTKHICRVCGERAVIVEDEGWACELHRTTRDGAVSSEPLDGAGESIPSEG